jgi:hypothetical protein
MVICLAMMAMTPAYGWSAEGSGSPEGTWHGAIDIPGRTLDVAVTLTVGDDAWTGSIDIPAQGVLDMSLSGVRIDGQMVIFAIGGGQASPVLQGHLSGDGQTLSGTLTQGPTSFPFVLERAGDGARLATPRRSQDPLRPFPYDEEDVIYRNDGAGISLAGTLTLPRAVGPFPAVLLVSLGGPQDRDATVMGHKRFLVLADHLTRRGLAVLRVDDRGVGGSGAAKPSDTASDLADDVLAGVRYLANRADIASGKIGIIGHSAGAMVGLLAATRSPDVGFIVMMGGIAVPAEVRLDLEAEALGASAAAITRDRAIRTRIFDVIREASDVPLEARLRDVRGELLQIASDAGVNAAIAGPNIDRLLVNYATPAFRFGLNLDPQEVLARVQIPLLAINGDRDLQVSATENLAAIDSALEAAGNPDYTTVTLPGVNHMFQTSQTGSPAEYGTLDETIAPSALTLIGDWVESRTR